MATTNTVGQLTGIFKETYGDSVIDLAKYMARISDRVGFEQAVAIGSKYHQPVRVSMEHGFTYSAAGTSATTSAVSLLNPVAGQIADAQVAGAQIIGRHQVDYEAIARSMNGDKSAFISATKEVVRGASAAAVKRLEISMLHGQRGLGIISSVSGSSTTRAWVITDATWSPGIWAALEGATLDVLEPSDYTTKINTNAAVTVVSVDVANKTVNVSGNATDLGNIAAADILFFETASASTEMAGLDKILRNTGTLFNISASTYALWGGNVYSNTGPLSFGKLVEAVGLTASYGASAPACAMVSPRAFEVLNSDQAALRQYDASYSSNAKTGFRGIKFSCQVGDIEIVSNPFQKDGNAHIFVPSETKRIGATDLTFIRRHGDSEALILENSNTAGAEMRCYSHQAIFVEAPRHTVVMDGITY